MALLENDLKKVDDRWVVLSTFPRKVVIAAFKLVQFFVIG